MPKHNERVREILIRMEWIEKELERLRKLWSEFDNELQVAMEQEREEAGGE